MDFQPPTKDSDVAVDMGDSNTGADHNGIVLGRWKTSIFGCMDTLVPNAIMSCCCTGLSVAQISARLGVMDFKQVLAAFGVLYLVGLITACADSDFFDWLLALSSIVSVLCMTRLRWRIRALFNIPGSPLEDLAYSCCCGCCSVAQMASHVESYEPGQFSFAPRATLEGYSFI